MLSIPDFVLKYETYTDEELYEIYRTQDGYSNEAQEALKIVLEKKGGAEALLKRIEEQRIVEKEIQRIKKETAQLGTNGVDASFIKKTTTSTILSANQVSEIVDSKLEEVNLELEDKKIKPRTIVGSIIGGAIASVVGGVLWGVQIIYVHRIFYIFGFGLALLCYGIIKGATKQSKNNTVVLIATVISILLALLIGQLMFEVFGFRER